jgi:hypothetical protein
LNIYNALIKSSLLYGSETWRLTENNKRRVEATEVDAQKGSSRISRKERIKNITIKADSHIACRSHAEPMPFPCNAVPLRV